MSNTIWRDFIKSIKENTDYRNRIKTLDSDIGDYLDTGPQEEGSPYTTKRASFRRKKFNDISAPPGAVGGLEEEVEPESFEVQDGLEPQIWDVDSLKPAIRNKLIKVVQDFIDDLPVEVDVEDITLTGSLANYNWSNYSDVDLHIIVDFLTVDENSILVKAFFDNARMRWNNKHQIRMKGYDVEIYVEDAAETHQSSGIYSLLKNEWIAKPPRTQPRIDFPAARRKAEDIEFQVHIVNNLITARKFKVAMKNAERLKQKIRNMRRAGLESRKREFSVENIAFKILRRDGTLKLLDDLKNKIYDDTMTVGEG